MSQQDDPTATGAGVALIETYLNRDGTRQEDAVILFRDRRTGKYNDGGGKRDKGEHIMDTARRELKEESANLFRFSRSVLDNRLSVRHREYRCYFVRVTSPIGIQSAWYYANVKELQARRAPHEWVETDGMVRVYINDMLQNGIMNKRGDLEIRDANGQPIVIEGKTKAAIREGLLAYVIPAQAITLKPNKACQDKKLPAAILTKCYYV